MRGIGTARERPFKVAGGFRLRDVPLRQNVVADPSNVDARANLALVLAGASETDAAITQVAYALEAVLVASEAESATPANQPALRQAIRQRLALYRAGKAFTLAPF